MNSKTWRGWLHTILDASATALDMRSSVRLEPVARDSEIMETFRSFTILTRLRVHLRIPNPDLNQFTRDLAESMEAARIRDFLQDMKNPNGLSQEPQRFPHAAASMADNGYKEGRVRMEGVIDGKRQTKFSGENAERIPVEGDDLLQDFALLVSGLNVNARGAELKRALQFLMDWIRDKLSQAKAE